jgi:hypothetical protein
MPDTNRPPFDMPGLLIIATIFFVIVWCLIAASSAGRLQKLNKKIPLPWGKSIGRAINRPTANAPRRFESLVFMVLALVCLGVAISFGNYGLLVYLYGFSRVRDEHLHFLGTPKGHPWPVSNGDLVQTDVHPMQFVITAVVWLGMTIPICVLVRLLLPRAKAT